ncbi:hypothetical protein FL857_04380 [Criibacterium bergeronii]|uniref:Uncharacterized protein n=1 Tax=Criibacterium bergeronii TaxID=1871336 RepID=A0A552VBN6_9FIRM|nr:hypothetical protein [Criibacterium bergeronii]TRW27810.1 hypothetical protein FL857_04380 [Criibacterium bergeronii]
MRNSYITKMGKDTIREVYENPNNFNEGEKTQAYNDAKVLNSIGTISNNEMILIEKKLNNN